MALGEVQPGSGGRVVDERRWAQCKEALEAVLVVLREGEAALAYAEEQTAWAIEQVEDGVSFRELVARAQRPLLLEVITSHLQALAAAGTRLRRLSAHALQDEGLTIEQIAKEFGVSRQRVSMLLRADPDSPGPSWIKDRDS